MWRVGGVASERGGGENTQVFRQGRHSGQQRNVVRASLGVAVDSESIGKHSEDSDSQSAVAFLGKRECQSGSGGTARHGTSLSATSLMRLGWASPEPSAFQITRAFLPSMIDKKTGHIVAISSLSGLMGTSKYSSFWWAPRKRRITHPVGRRGINRVRLTIEFDCTDRYQRIIDDDELRAFP